MLDMWITTYFSSRKIYDLKTAEMIIEPHLIT